MQSQSPNSTWRPWPPSYAAGSCTLCQGTGWLLVSHSGKAAARRCCCGMLSRTVRLKDRVRVPRRYEHCSFDNYVPSNLSQVRALREARRFASRFPNTGRGLFFAGDAGVGKTHLAIAILREIVRRFHGDPVFVDFEDLVVQERRETGRDGEWVRLSGASLVVIDNFGISSAAGALDLRLLEAMLDSRLRHGRPLILTGERVRLEHLMEDSPLTDASVTESFLRRIHPSLLYALSTGLRHVSLSGSDFRRTQSESSLFKVQSNEPGNFRSSNLQPSNLEPRTLNLEL